MLRRRRLLRSPIVGSVTALLLSRILGSASKEGRAAADTIEFEFASVNRDGSEADVVQDLRTLGNDANWVVDELRRLSAAGLRYRCQPLKAWPRSTEGEWVIVEIPPFWVLAQLGLRDPSFAGTSLAGDLFKIVRIVHRNDVREELDKVRASLEVEDQDLGW